MAEIKFNFQNIEHLNKILNPQKGYKITYPRIKMDNIAKQILTK